MQHPRLRRKGGVLIARALRRRRRLKEEVFAYDPEIVRRLARRTEESLFPEQDNGRTRLHRALRQAWEHELTSCQRKYLHLYYEETLTMREIAEQNGVNIATVSRTLKRARERLRHVLQYYIAE